MEKHPPSPPGFGTQSLLKVLPQQKPFDHLKQRSSRGAFEERRPRCCMKQRSSQLIGQRSLAV